MCPTKSRALLMPPVPTVCASCSTPRHRDQPCGGCGAPPTQGNTTRRGYGSTHQQRAALLIAAEPWCHNPNCPHTDVGTPSNPLTLEHLDPADRNGPVTVTCHRCNSGHALA